MVWTHGENCVAAQSNKGWGWLKQVEGRSRPKFGWMDGVKVSLDRGITEGAW